MPPENLFLQNSLAMAATLLNQSVKVLNDSPSPEAICLIIEIRQFFLEMRESLSLKVRTERTPSRLAGSPGIAPIVGNNGVDWKAPPEIPEPPPGDSPSGPVWIIPEKRIPTGYEAEPYYPTSNGISSYSSSTEEKTLLNPFLD